MLKSTPESTQFPSLLRSDGHPATPHNGVKLFLKEYSYIYAPEFSRDDLLKFQAVTVLKNLK